MTPLTNRYASTWYRSLVSCICLWYSAFRIEKESSNKPYENNWFQNTRWNREKSNNDETKKRHQQHWNKTNKFKFFRCIAMLVHLSRCLGFHLFVFAFFRIVVMRAFIFMLAAVWEYLKFIHIHRMQRLIDRIKLVYFFGNPCK